MNAACALLPDMSHVRSAAGNSSIPCAVALLSLASARSKPINHPKSQRGHLKRPEASPTGLCAFQSRDSQKQEDFSTSFFSIRLRKAPDQPPRSPVSSQPNSNEGGITLYSQGTCPQRSRRGFGISYLANELHSSCSQ